MIVSLALGASVKQESSNCTRNNGDNGNYHPQYQSTPVSVGQSSDFLEISSDRCFG